MNGYPKPFAGRGCCSPAIRPVVRRRTLNRSAARLADLRAFSFAFSWGGLVKSSHGVDSQQRQPRPESGFLPGPRALVDLHGPRTRRRAGQLQFTFRCTVRRGGNIRAACRVRRGQGVRFRDGPRRLPLWGGRGGEARLDTVYRAHFLVRRLCRPGLVWRDYARPAELPRREPAERAGGSALPGADGGADAALPA